jgi:hypothetical protein
MSTRLILAQPPRFASVSSRPRRLWDIRLLGFAAFVIAMTEGVEVEPDCLVKVAPGNARAAVPGSRIVEQDFRYVGGRKVIYMCIDGVMEGIRLSYLGYYWSDATGSTQPIAYTATNLIAKYVSDIENFLNGFDMCDSQEQRARPDPAMWAAQRGRVRAISPHDVPGFARTLPDADSPRHPPPPPPYPSLP